MVESVSRRKFNGLAGLVGAGAFGAALSPWAAKEMDLKASGLTGQELSVDEMDAYHYNMAQWEAGNLQYGSLKGDVAKALVELTGKFRQNLESIRQNEAEVKEKVLQSSARIRLRAQKTMAEVREITGLTTLWH